MNRVAAILTPLISLVALCCATPAGADPLRVTGGRFEAGWGFLSEPLFADGLSLFGGGLAVGAGEDWLASFYLTNPAPSVDTGTLADFSGVLTVLPGQFPFSARL